MVSKLKCHFIRNINIHSRMTEDKQTNRHKKKGKKQQHQHQNDVAFNFENVFVRWFGSFAYALNMCEARIRKQFSELFTVYIKERMNGKREKEKKRGSEEKWSIDFYCLPHCYNDQLWQSPFEMTRQEFLRYFPLWGTTSAQMEENPKNLVHNRTREENTTMCRT